MTTFPKTTARNAFPGDTARVLSHDAADSAGRQWPKGTVMTPSSSGFSNTRWCSYREYTCGALLVRFEANKRT